MTADEIPKCYNVGKEDQDDEDLINIQILETKVE
jgi:hypothetical protein